MERKGLSWTILDRSWKVYKDLKRSWIHHEDIWRDLQTYRRPRRSWIDQESMSWMIFYPSKQLWTSVRKYWVDFPIPCTRNWKKGLPKELQAWCSGARISLGMKFGNGTPNSICAKCQSRKRGAPIPFPSFLSIHLCSKTQPKWFGLTSPSH